MNGSLDAGCRFLCRPTGRTEREGRTVAKSDDKVSGRRDFLKLATVGAPALAAAAVAGSSEAMAAEVKTELGYSETKHVKAYLDSCRF
jgi:hypothetical protein